MPSLPQIYLQSQHACPSKLVDDQIIIKIIEIILKILEAFPDCRKEFIAVQCQMWNVQISDTIVPRFLDSVFALKLLQMVFSHQAQLPAISNELTSEEKRWFFDRKIFKD